jgi:hypothetical protein
MKRCYPQRGRACLDQQLPAKSGIRAAWGEVLKAVVLRHSARVRGYLSTLLQAAVRQVLLTARGLLTAS